MKIPATLPVTAEQSRAARFQLGETQASLIAESGLPGWKVKQFETGRFVPDMPFLEALRDYYKGKGIQFGDQPTAQLKTPTTSNQADNRLVEQVPRMGFYVSDDLPDEVVQSMLERMADNEEKIRGLMDSRVESGWLSEFDEETQVKVRQLAAALAENHLLFCSLQGRNLLVRPAKEYETIADVFASIYAESPAITFMSGEVDATSDEAGESEVEGAA